MRLFSVQIHVGTAGNERANELVSNSALNKKTAVNYDLFPLSYAKKVIRAIASLDVSRERYAEGSIVQMTPLMAQTPTGHGGFAQYLQRFEQKNSPYYALARSGKMSNLSQGTGRDRGGHRRRNREAERPRSIVAKKKVTVTDITRGTDVNLV
ncbi:hypothetical protein EVAR_50652_1 [Eumeta japonica]|uniref:RNase H type-1 domain-containing protein n=1 Tax=Eumeta variegata TaxID=151549 RepID=A0A4C1XIM0_EUMVA|nr:hypothetical protein EVAR_50652_1 [Eumeta japonica]